MPAADRSTEPPLRRVADAAAALVAGRLLRQLAGFAAEVALVRFLSPDAWEAVSRFLTFSLTAQVALQFGFPESLLSLGSRATEHAEAKRMLFRSGFSLSVIGLLFALALWPMTALRVRFLGSAEPSVLLAFAVLLCAELVSGLVPSFLVSRRFVKEAASFGVLSRVPAILGILVALAFGSALPAVTNGLALGSAVGAIGGLLWCERLVPNRGATRVGLDFRAQLQFAVPVGLTRLGQMLNNQLDKLVVLAALPGAAFGTYYLGAVEMQLVPMLCQTVTSVMMPELVTARNREHFVSLLHASMEKLFLFALPCFAFLFVFAERGFAAIYGVEHRDAALPFRIFQLLLLHRFTNYAMVFQALGKPRVPLLASLLMLSVNAPLSFVLARWMGPVGAAAATVGSLYLSSIYTFFELRRALDVTWSSLIPWHAYLRTAAVAFVSLGPAYVVSLVRAPQGLLLIVTLLVYVVTYFLLGRASGAISRADALFVSDMARLRFLQAKHSA